MDLFNYINIVYAVIYARVNIQSRAHLDYVGKVS